MPRWVSVETSSLHHKCSHETQGNEYSSREYIQPDGSTAPGYQYSNVDGSYFYSNPDGSKYHNNGDSKTRYTSADGSGWEKKIFAATAASNLSSQSQTSTRVTNSEEVQHIRGTVGAEPASTAGTAGPQLKSQAERVDFSARLDEIFTSYGAGYDHGYKDGYNDGCDDEA